MKRSFVSLVFFVLSACSNVAYIPPSASNKPCIQNFRTEGSILSGKRYATYAPLSSRSRAKILSQVLAQLPALGFKVDRINKGNGTVRALHLNTLKNGIERAAILEISINSDSKSPIIDLSFETKPGQFSAEGEIQDEFCKIIASTEVKAVDY